MQANASCKLPLFMSFRMAAKLRPTHRRPFPFSNRRRRKFTAPRAIQPAKAYEDESVMIGSCFACNALPVRVERRSLMAVKSCWPRGPLSFRFQRHLPLPALVPECAQTATSWPAARAQSTSALFPLLVWLSLAEQPAFNKYDVVRCPSQDLQAKLQVPNARSSWVEQLAVGILRFRCHLDTSYSCPYIHIQHDRFHHPINIKKA